MGPETFEISCYVQPSPCGNMVDLLPILASGVLSACSLWNHGVPTQFMWRHERSPVVRALEKMVLTYSIMDMLIWFQKGHRKGSWSFLWCRRLATLGHKNMVDDLVYELLRKMARGGVPWLNKHWFVKLKFGQSKSVLVKLPVRPFTIFHPSHVALLPAAGECHCHPKSCGPNCQARPWPHSESKQY